MNTPRISPAEWQVMKVLWQQAPRTANEVIEALKSESDWHPKTIRTLLRRLREKEAVRAEKRDGVYVFSPAVEEAACVREESRTFLQRFFDGGLQPMLAHFLEHEDVSEEELRSLRKLLDSRPKGGTRP